MSLKLRPCTLREANDFVEQYHRHHKSAVGHKFSVSVEDEGIVHGVAICGRPVGRYLDDGYTLEINRLCTDGTRNACSMLYGACSRIARSMGYHRVVTYILASEPGTSLKASNFVCEGEAGKEMWTGARSGHCNGVHKEKKKRWVRYLTNRSDAAH